MLSEFDLQFTAIFQRIKMGDDDAFAELYQTLHERVKEVAQRKINQSRAPTQSADADDIVDSVFMRFRTRAMGDYFSKFSDRKALWYLLVKITHDRVVGLVRHENFAKRDKSRTFRLDGDTIECFQQTAEVVVQLEDTLKFLLDHLDDDKLKLREIARYVFDEYPKQEISERIGVSIRTVERRLQLIKEKWSALDAEIRVNEIIK